MSSGLAFDVDTFNAVANAATAFFIYYATRQLRDAIVDIKKQLEDLQRQALNR